MLQLDHLELFFLLLLMFKILRTSLDQVKSTLKHLKVDLASIIWIFQQELLQTVVKSKQHVYRKPLCFSMLMQPVSPLMHKPIHKLFKQMQTTLKRSNIFVLTNTCLSSHTFPLSLLLWCLCSAAPRQNEPPLRLRTPFLWQSEQASEQDTAKGWGQIPHWALRTLTNTPHSYNPSGVAPHGTIHNTQGTDLSVTGQRCKTPEKQLWSK